MANLKKKLQASSKVTVEQYKNEYAFMVGELISSIQREEFNVPITLKEQPDLVNIQNYYQTGNGNFWVALSEGNVVGTIALLDISNRQTALRKMFVAPNFRGSATGTAHKLLETLLNWAKEKGVSDIFLGTTAQFYAAHRFYEKTGFVDTPKDSLPQSFPIMSVDTKFFRMNLEN